MPGLPRDSKHPLHAWSRTVRRAAAWIIAAFVIVDVGLAWYVARNISIDTDTLGMLSSDLDWRRDRDAYLEAFPHENDTLLVVIDAPTPEGADLARDRLAQQLERSAPQTITEIYRPGGGEYFDRHGLLFMDVDELEAFGRRLAAAQPFFGRLAARPTAASLIETTALAEEAIGDPETLGDLHSELADSFAAMGREQSHWVSWRSLVRAEQAPGEQSTAPDEPRSFLALRVDVPKGEVPPGAGTIAAVRDAADAIGLDEDGVRVRLTGTVALRHDEFQSLREEAGLIAVASVALVGVVLYAGLRSKWLVTASLITLVSGLIITAAFATLTVGKLNMISVAFAALYIGLGIDYPIHLGLRYQEMLRQGRDRHEAIEHAMRQVGPSLGLCALTTSLGFFAFLPTSFVGVAQLGLIAGVGMFVSLVVSASLFPALLTVVPIGLRKSRPGRAANSDAQDPDGEGSADLATSLPRLIAFESRRHPRWVLTGTALVAIACSALAMQARFDADRMNLRAPNSESMRALEDLESSVTTSPQVVTVLAGSMEEAQRLASSLSALEPVRSTRVLIDFVPKDQDPKLAILEDLLITVGPLPEMPDEPPPEDPAETLDAMGTLLEALDQSETGHDNPAHARLRTELADAIERMESATDAQRRELVAQLRRSVLSTLPGLIERLNTALDAGPVALDDLPASLVQRWRSGDNGQVWRVEVRPEQDTSDERVMRRFVGAVRAVAPDATGPPVVTLEAGDSVVSAFQMALGLAAAGIALTLVIVLRSLRESLIVLVAIGLTGLLTAGISVVLGIPFNFANVISVPLILGFGVDSAIHIVHRAKELRTPQDRLVSTSTARGVLFSSLTTMAGFGGLILSEHPGTRSLGVLLIPGVLFSTLAALIVVPAMIAPVGAEPGKDRTPKR